MRFFEAQARARRATILLSLSTLVVVLTLAGLAGFAVYWMSQLYVHTGQDPKIYGLVTTAAFLALMFGGMIYKSIKLGRGGYQIAYELGGRSIDLDSSDPAEKRALNLVEEMAIASGLPVPEVFALPDATINAFAAGLTPADAVIGLTDGAMRKLSRQELQGVVAHEFSHILNGDMRLNLRFAGILFGLTLITRIGRGMLTGGARTRHRRRRSKDRAVIPGLVIYLFGMLGTLAARLLQSAVSRQREYLADAHAVQFTRNPEGVAHALNRIRMASGSHLQSARRDAYAHMLFSDPSQ